MRETERVERVSERKRKRAGERTGENRGGRCIDRRSERLRELRNASENARGREFQTFRQTEMVEWASVAEMGRGRGREEAATPRSSMQAAAASTPRSSMQPHPAASTTQQHARSSRGQQGVENAVAGRSCTPLGDRRKHAATARGEAQPHPGAARSMFFAAAGSSSGKNQGKEEHPLLAAA